MAEKNHNKTMMQIDGERLKKAIARKGLKITDAGIALGRSKNFIANSIREGWIHKATIQLLDERFGIKAAEYELREEEPKEGAKEDGMAELKEIISAAVLDALVRFMEERSPEGITKIMEQWRTEK